MTAFSTPRSFSFLYKPKVDNKSRFHRSSTYIREFRWNLIRWEGKKYNNKFMKEWLNRTLETWIIEATQFFISEHVSYLMNLIECNSFLHFLTIFFLLIEGISNRMIILFFFFSIHGPYTLYVAVFLGVAKTQYYFLL